MYLTCTLGCLSGLATLASTILPCFRAVREWKPLFFVEYAFVECMTGWGFISPFLRDLRSIIRRCVFKAPSDMDVGQTTTMQFQQYVYHF